MVPNKGTISVKNCFWEALLQLRLEDGRGEIKQRRLDARTSLVARWLRTHLPMQGTWVQSLVREDPTCHGATKPVRHNY